MPLLTMHHHLLLLHLYMASVCNNRRGASEYMFHAFHGLRYSRLVVCVYCPGAGTRAGSTARRMCRPGDRGRRGGGGRPANRRTGVRPGAGTHMAAHA